MTVPAALRAAILGGTGYGGMELFRYLSGHRQVDVVALTSRSDTGPIAARHPHLRRVAGKLAFTPDDPTTRLALARDVDVVFSAKPHGVAANELPPLLEGAPNCRVIDLSGDFRLRDAAAYDPWYGFTHPHPAWLADAAYGLPECGRRDAIRGARLVANPGCHASAVALALWPLSSFGSRAARGPASVSSVTGSSGSGAIAKAGTHHPERFANFKAYRPLRHQHVPEVEQLLGRDTRLAFVPHSAPFARGIYVTAFVPTGDTDPEAVRSAFVTAYDDEPFVTVTDAPPQLRAVVGTNDVEVHVACGDGVAVVTLALDNLGKGMASSAVQNMNLLFGLDERAGLDRPGAGL